MKGTKRYCVECGVQFRAISLRTMICSVKCHNKRETKLRAVRPPATPKLTPAQRKEREDERIYQEFMDRERQRAAAKLIPEPKL